MSVSDYTIAFYLSLTTVKPMRYLGVKIPDELANALEDTGRPKSEVVREALETYLEVEREIPYQTEIIKLIDERIAFNAGKTIVKPMPDNSKTKVKFKLNQDTIPELNASKTVVKPKLSRDKIEVKPALNDDKTTVKQVLQVIKDFHGRGIEPTAAEVAKKMGMESRPLGRIMKEAGIQAVNCHRGGVKARRYTFDMKEKIERMTNED